VRIGIPKEIKLNENRVALTPGGVRELVTQGHEVLVEANAGAGAGFDESTYRKAGARITDASDIFASSHMVLKVKEPQPQEIEQLRPGRILFTYLPSRRIGLSRKD
jgi:alanine dehydrogenase